MKRFLFLFLTFSYIFFSESCKEKSPKQTNTPIFEASEDFKSYWYSGEAEITSYELEQARYGELREGTATLIFVTEDFLPNEQVKTNRDVEKLSVLKLNANKKFNTGIYPYSIMQSIFYPVKNNRHALKVTASVQEWCGQTFTQLNNRNGFQVSSHSYFEEEGDQEFELEYAFLENEFWTQIRIDPSSLPEGEIQVVPALEYIRLHHQELKAYKAEAELTKNDSLDVFVLNYPELQRKLKIYFQPDFPYEIEKWEEINESGFGEKAKKLTTKAERKKRIKSAYWKRNSNKDLYLRKKLDLN